jgi:hypothetical protein
MLFSTRPFFGLIFNVGGWGAVVPTHHIHAVAASFEPTAATIIANTDLPRRVPTHLYYQTSLVAHMTKAE